VEQTSGEVEPSPHVADTVDGTTREWLIKQLRRVLEIALDRVESPKTPPNDRIKWCRVVIAAGQATNSILHDVDIEALKEQVNELREMTEERFEDEQDSDQESDSANQEAA